MTGWPLCLERPPVARSGLEASGRSAGLSLLATAVWDRIFQKSHPCEAAVEAAEKRKAKDEKTGKETEKTVTVDIGRKAAVGGGVLHMLYQRKADPQAPPASCYRRYVPGRGWLGEERFSGAHRCVAFFDDALYVFRDDNYSIYRARDWREVPFDYGEQRDRHGWGMGARSAPLIAALPTPGHRSNPFWHMGGIDVSVKGHIVVTTCNLVKPEDRRTLPEKATFRYLARPYTPKLYPGRMRWGEIHVYDDRGKFIYQDAVPGMGHLNGIGIDQYDGIYMMAAVRRLIGGKKYDPTLPRDASGTLIKVKPGRVKVLAAGKGRRTPAC